MDPDDQIEDDATVTDLLPAERTEQNLDRLFGVIPDDEDTPPKKKVSAAVRDDEDEEEEDISEDSDDEESEEDYESPVKPKKGAEDEEIIKDESHARRLAKENGRRAKELEARLQERQLEFDRQQADLEAARKRLEEVEATQIKPHEHPDFVALQQEVFRDAGLVARRLPGRAKLLLTAGNNFGVLMGEYIASTEAEGEALLTADEKLASTIVKTLELSELSYEELTFDEQRELQPVVDKVVDALERNLPKTRELQNLATKLSARAKSGMLTGSVREYEEKANFFKPVLDAVGNLPDEVLESSPHSIEAVVSRMVKESPEAAKRLKSATRDVMEVVVGPRPLTQDEVDRLEANGTDIKTFIVERNKALHEKQKKLIPLFVQALVTRSTFKQTLEELAKFREEQDGDDEEFDAIRRTLKRPAPKKEDKEKNRSRRPGAAADKLFGPED